MIQRLLSRMGSFTCIQQILANQKRQESQLEIRESCEVGI